MDKTNFVKQVLIYIFLSKRKNLMKTIKPKIVFKIVQKFKS